VLLVLLNSDQPEVVAAADRLYQELAGADVDVLYDDRTERPGVKFNDADLIGFPVRVVVGSRGLADGQVEISLRRDGVKRMVNAADTVAEIESLLEQLRIDVGE
jgi:prolyl-tRNA synthetase